MGTLILATGALYLLILIYAFYTTTVFTVSMRSNKNKNFYFITNITLYDLIRYKKGTLNKVISIKQY